MVTFCVFHIKFSKENGKRMGKTENMPQPQWEQSFDLEIDEEKEVLNIDSASNCKKPQFTLPPIHDLKANF